MGKVKLSRAFSDQRRTRFPELVYRQIDHGEWSFFASDTDSRVGPIYPSKLELLADLSRYAKDSWGLS